MSLNIGGATRLYVLLGDPLGKARSPEYCNALFAARARGCAIATGRDMFEAQTLLAERLFGWGS